MKLTACLACATMFQKLGDRHKFCGWCRFSSVGRREPRTVITDPEEEFSLSPGISYGKINGYPITYQRSDMDGPASKVDELAFNELCSELVEGPTEVPYERWSPRPKKGDNRNHVWRGCATPLRKKKE